jgi:basic membrane protein A
MSIKIGRRTLVTSALAAGTLAYGSRYSFAGDPLKVGFIYPSPIGDFGWSYRHEIGRQDLEKEFGGAIKTTFLESVAEGADSERVLTRLSHSDIN